MERRAETQGLPDEFKRMPILALDSNGAEIATRAWDDWDDWDAVLVEEIQDAWAAVLNAREPVFHFIAGGQHIQFEASKVLYAWSKMERRAETQGLPDEFKRMPILALDSNGAEIATRAWDDWHAALMEDIDAGIRPYLEKIWAAGYATEFSCSGLSRDHAPAGMKVTKGGVSDVEHANPGIIFTDQKSDAEHANPSIIFTDPNQRQTRSILFAARWSLGKTFIEEWFEAKRLWVFWRFRPGPISRWFYPYFLLLPERLQVMAKDLTYSMCLKIFAWLLAHSPKSDHQETVEEQ